MLGHENVAEDGEVVAGSEGFDHAFDDLFRSWGVEEGPAVVTSERDEVEVAFVLETLEAYGHVVIVREMVALVRDAPLMTKRCHEWGTRFCRGWGDCGGAPGGVWWLRWGDG